MTCLIEATRCKVMLIVAGVLACSCSQVAIPRGPVTVRPERIDAGEVFKGETIRVTFKLTNESSRDARISEIAADCRCSAVGNVGDLLRPGESSDVTISVETDYLEGFMTRTTHVTVDGVFTLPLPVEARVLPEFVPSITVVDLGNVPPEGPVERRFIVRRHERSLSELRSVSTTAPGVDVSIRRIDPAGREAEVVVQAEGRSEPGSSIRGNLWLHTTSTYLPAFPVPIRGRSAAANAVGAEKGTYGGSAISP